MKVMIVGGRSSLARTLICTLTNNAEVVTAGRAGCDVRLDLSEPMDHFKIPDSVDVVINSAAAFGGKNIEAFEEAVTVNILGALKLCRMCSNAKVKQLVMISSIFATLGKQSPFYGAYSLSKKQADEWVQAYASVTGLPVTILRPSQFYGVGSESRRHQPFLSTIIDRACNGEDILIYGKNDALRNFIHVQDLAKVISLLIQRRVVGLYSCAYPQNVRYSEIAAAAIEAFGSRSAIRFVEGKPDIPDNIFDFDDSLFRKIDYFPQISIATGMRMEAAHLRNARNENGFGIGS